MIKTLFAIRAFGMGSDIANIRGVVHFGPPASIEPYHPQRRRVGRDNKAAWAWPDAHLTRRFRQTHTKGSATH